jgi:4a-hydroxytetrahydrobiopterin dehydratase
MTETLAEKTCTPCRGGVPPLARDEALRFQSQAPDWELRDDDRRIERTFRFHNFREALAFVQQVGELAESEGHHPRYQFRLGSRDRFSKHQEDQGIARERFHHGEQDRPHGRSAGSDNRNSAVTLRDADGLVATGGVSTFPSFSRSVSVPPPPQPRLGYAAGPLNRHGAVTDD